MGVDVCLQTDCAFVNNIISRPLAVADDMGGTLWFVSATGRIERTIFRNNTVSREARVLGGALRVDSSNVHLSDSSFERNSDGGRYGKKEGGSAIYCTSAAKLLIESTRIFNHESRAGAAVTLQAGCSIEMSDTEIRDCVLDSFTGGGDKIGAGGMWVINGALSLRSSQLVRNAAAVWCTIQDRTKCSAGSIFDKTKQCCADTNGECQNRICAHKGKYSPGVGGNYRVAADILVENVQPCFFRLCQPAVHNASMPTCRVR